LWGRLFYVYGRISLTYRAYGGKEAQMPKLKELLRLVNESSSRTARIQALAAKMDTHTLDDYDANLLSAHLE
ncbi:hypothetical protein DK853_50660, partial [Klebsiella oxytoca]